MKDIGAIIHEHRTAKSLTQEELGKQLFVSKQAVSKWETGRTVPDIETVRRLCSILDISNEEILVGSISETNKKHKRLNIAIGVSAVCMIIAVITSLSLAIALFFGLDGVGFIKRNTQSGVAYISIYNNGALLSADSYHITSDIPFENHKNAYRIDIDYGEVRGIAHVDGKYDIEYGFINTNNWHNVQIRLDITKDGDSVIVTQTVSYETDGNVFSVLVTEAESTETNISVYRPGV